MRRLAAAAALLALAQVATPARAGFQQQWLGALTITGSHTGYATVDVDRDTVLDYQGVQVVRTGHYAGAVVEWGQVIFATDELPSVPPGVFYGGASYRLRPGRYKVYLVTEDGQPASVRIPWDRPSRGVVVGDERVPYQVGVTRAAPGQQSVVLPQTGAGAYDRIWGMSFFESRQAVPQRVRVGACVTRRATCDRGMIFGFQGVGSPTVNTIGIGFSTYGDVRGSRVIGYVASPVAAPMSYADSLTVWSLRLGLGPGHDVPTPVRRTSFTG